MKKLILSALILSFLSSCSHLGSRSPSSYDGNCFNLFGEVFDETSQSHLALGKLNEMEVSVDDPEKVLEFEEYLSELREKILAFGNDELQGSWVSLMSSFQQYKYSGSSFETFKSSWETYKSNFFIAWREAEKSELLKSTQQVSKIEEEAKAVVKSLQEDEIETMELISKRTAVIQGVWAKAQAADGELQKEELADFTYWLFSKANLDQADSTHIYDNINTWLVEYKEAAKHMSKSTRNNMIIEGKKNILTLHNQVTKKFIDDFNDVKSLKKHSLIYIELFSLLEPRFDQEGFTKYLLESDFFSDQSLGYYKGIKNAEGIDINLGMMLRDQYQKFAPYQDRPPAVNKTFVEVTVERTRDLWDKLKRNQKSCADLDCYNKEATNGWLDIFRLRTYKKAFSCMSNNPVVLKSMVMDMGIVWGGLTWYYYQNPESFQRFPMEVMINSAVFAPVMAEANCRTSFKGNLSFGTEIPEKEVITSLLTKTNRVFRNLRGVAFKGFLSSVGLLSLTNGLDHLFLALGYKVATPLSINDISALLPISFLYHGVWLGVKNMAIINPIRHKVIPRLAEALAKKAKLNKAYWPLQTGLDFGAYHAFATLGKYDYLIFYSAVLLPFIKEYFSVGTDLEHKEELIRENVVEHTFVGVDDSGVETKVVVEEDKKGIPDQEGSVQSSEGTIQVRSVEVEVPDDVIDSWADKILSGLPQD